MVILGTRFPGLRYSPLKVVVTNSPTPSQECSEEGEIKSVEEKTMAENERKKHLELLSACVTVEKPRQGSRVSPSPEKLLKTGRTPSRLLNILKRMNNKLDRRSSYSTNNLEKEKEQSLNLRTEKMCDKVKNFCRFSKNRFEDKPTVKRTDNEEHFEDFFNETAEKIINENEINFADITNEIIDPNTEFYASKAAANAKPKTPPPPLIGPVEIGSPKGLFFSRTNTKFEDWIKFIPLPMSSENETSDNENSLEDYESLNMSISSGESPLSPYSPCDEPFQYMPTTHTDVEISSYSDVEIENETYVPCAKNLNCKEYDDPVEDIWDRKVNELLKKTREKWEQDALAKRKDVDGQVLKFDGKKKEKDAEDFSHNTKVSKYQTRVERKLNWRDILKLEHNADEYSQKYADGDAEKDVEEKEMKLDASSSPIIKSNCTHNHNALTNLTFNKPREKSTMCLAKFLEEQDHDCEKIKESGKKCVMVTFVT